MLVTKTFLLFYHCACVCAMTATIAVSHLQLSSLFMHVLVAKIQIIFIHTTFLVPKMLTDLILSLMLAYRYPVCACTKESVMVHLSVKNPHLYWVKHLLCVVRNNIAICKKITCIRFGSVLCNSSSFLFNIGIVHHFWNGELDIVETGQKQTPSTCLCSFPVLQPAWEQAFTWRVHNSVHLRGALEENSFDGQSKSSVGKWRIHLPFLKSVL